MDFLMKDPNADVDPEVKRIWARCRLRQIRALENYQREHVEIVEAYKQEMEAYCLKTDGKIPTQKDYEELVAQLVARDP